MTLTNDFNGYDMITRAAWSGSTLFTISGRQIRSANLDSLAQIGSVELPGYDDSQRYYFGGGIAVDSLIK